VIGSGHDSTLPNVDIDNNIYGVYICPMTTSPSASNLTGRTILITGATSGIGRATAVAVASRGARVILAVRDTDKGHQVAADLPGAASRHVVRELDLADLTSVRRFTDDTTEHIDVLVNNAGVSNPALLRTKDGFESQFGTNHLGHFLLTTLLLPQLTARVVTVSSQAERMGRLNLQDLNWHSRPYAGARAYADSKLANLMFTLELDRRLQEAGSSVRAIAAHPGLVTTAIYDKPAGMRPGLWDYLLPILGQDPDQGALPVLYAITEDVPGGTFTGPEHMFHMRGGAQIIKTSTAAKDTTLSADLWAASEDMTRVTATR
jgi:NAD(P)-dependent dehydrogenase (short-subunit alcohol dehydrogenase family)